MEHFQQEMRRLERLPPAALRREYTNEWGLPLEPGMDDRKILELIKVMLVWNALPVHELRKECEESEVAVQGSGQWESERQELIQRLIAESCVTRWCELGVPVKRIGEVSKAAAVVERLAHIERLPGGASLATRSAALRREWAEAGFQLPPDGISGEEAKGCLKLACIWQQLPVHELKVECSDRGVPLTRVPCDGGEEAQRGVLLRGLLLHECAGHYYGARGVPVRRLGSVEAAAKVLARTEQLEAASLRELLTEFGRLELPRPGLSRERLLEGLRAAALWEELPVPELEEECRDRGIRVAAAGKMATGDCGADRRSELLGRLLISIYEREYESRGVPAQRLGSVGAANHVLQAFEELEALSNEAVEARLAALGLPRPAGAARGELLAELRRHALWSQLPAVELRLLLQESGLPSGACRAGAGPAESRRELLERLLAARRRKAFEGSGVPVARLASPTAAPGLASRFDALQAMNDRGLREECSRLGLPEPPDAADRAQLLKGLRWALVCHALSFVELKKECVAVGVKGFHSAPESHRPQMLSGLLRAAWDEAAPRRRGARTANAGARPGGARGCAAAQRMAGHFQKLGLGVGANHDDVRRAYKRLALKYHPDKCSADSEQHSAAAFLEITEAYEELRGLFDGRT